MVREPNEFGGCLTMYTIESIPRAPSIRDEESVGSGTGSSGRRRSFRDNCCCRCERNGTSEKNKQQHAFVIATIFHVRGRSWRISISVSTVHEPRSNNHTRTRSAHRLNRDTPRCSLRCTVRRATAVPEGDDGDAYPAEPNALPPVQRYRRDIRPRSRSRSRAEPNVGQRGIRSRGPCLREGPYEIVL